MARAGRRRRPRAAWYTSGMMGRRTELREGLEMVEEKARGELGMVRPNEIYVQIVK